MQALRVFDLSLSPSQFADIDVGLLLSCLLLFFLMQMIAFFLSALILFVGCSHNLNVIHPEIEPLVQDTYLQNLPSPPSSLTLQERSEGWGEEYWIGKQFGKSLDLYRAITAFKRAEFLLPRAVSSDRLAAIHYQILLCYYLGKRYDEVIQEFTHSTLYKLPNSPPTDSDLLILLYDSYLKTGDVRKGASILRRIQEMDPEIAENLQLSTDLIEGNLKAISKTQKKAPLKTDLKHLLERYNAKKKSTAKAQIFNALLPGAGYFYVGQKQSALTSFLLNGLSIWAAIHFYTHGHLAAGILTTSLEMGWYFGGIYGAAESAKLYNKCLYEREASPLLNHYALFPVFMLKYGF